MTTNAQNHNRYTYCLNNPLRYTDPSGYRFSFMESFNTLLDDTFLGLMFNNCLGGYLYDEDGGGSGSFTHSSGGYTDWVTGTTYTSTADMVSAAWNNTPDGSIMSYFFTDGQLDCVNEGFALPGAVIYGSWHMGIWRTTSVHFPDCWGVVNLGDTWDGDGCGGGLSMITPVGGTNNGLGGIGTGMSKLEGSFRLTKGGYFSPKYYPSNWQGGSRARITTYSAAECGKRISRGSFLVSLGLGAIDIDQAYSQDGETFGYNTQVATAQTVGDILGSLAGAEFGVMAGAAIGSWAGGVGAIPCALIGGFVGGILGGWGGSGLGGAIVNLFH